KAIQKAFDDRRTGVRVITVDIPLLRPQDLPAGSFEELAISHQASKQRIAYMERNQSVTTTYWVGDDELAQRVNAALEELESLQNNSAPNAQAIAEKKKQIELWLRRGGGQAAKMIGEAERDRWVAMM